MTPASAGWGYVGFAAYRLQPGESVSFEDPAREACLVVLAGKARVQAGSIDCAITGTLSGNGLGLQAVTSHMHAMPLNWGVALFAANLSAWEALPADLRTLLRKELPPLEAAIWEESERDTAQGIACNTGQSACTKGVKGNMVLVPMSAQDERKRQDIFVSTVLPRWLQRCGPRCAEIWNQTIGLARGLPAPDKP